MASWIDKVQTEMLIVTGDGAGYTPDYLTASVSRSKEFNFSKFEFVGVKGSLVVRKQPMGMAYDLQIIFQGDLHLDTADAFSKSADNPNHWTITHPYYGRMMVQPLGLRQDNGENNTSVISCTVIESISSTKLAPMSSPADVAAGLATTTAVALNTSFTSNTPIIHANTVSVLSSRLYAIYTAVSSYISNLQDQVNAYRNQYNQANALLNAAAYDVVAITDAAENIILAPVYFTNSILDRVNLFITAYNLIANDANTIAAKYTDAYKELKQLFENNAGAAVTGLLLSTVTNIATSDYGTRNDVIAVISQVIGVYNAYILYLDELQTATGGTVTSYIPDPGPLTALDTLLNYTVSNLFAIASSAKQQRFYTLPEDSNVIDVTNLLYGMDNDDANIDALIAQNNIVGYELLELRKGRVITYYV